MSNGFREQIRQIIEDNVRVVRMVYDNGDFVFAYVGRREAAELIVQAFYDRLESIDCE